MKKLIMSLSVLSALSSPLAMAECQIVPVDGAVETRCKLPDMTDSQQRKVIDVFIDRLREMSKDAHLPKEGTELADAALDKLQNDVTPIINLKNSAIIKKRRGREMGSSDLMFDGLFGVVGGNASFGAYLSGGASAMVAVIAAPVWVRSIDDFTGKQTDYIRLDTSIGGLATLGVGAGVGGGGGFRYGVGLIWGDLPKADDVFNSGFTLGFDGDAEAAQGFGLSAAFPKNKETGLRNTVIFLHGDTGAKADLEAHGTGFWFLTPDQMMKISHLNKIFGDGANPTENIPVATPVPAPAPAAPAPASPIVAK